MALHIDKKQPGVYSKDDEKRTQNRGGVHCENKTIGVFDKNCRMRLHLESGAGAIYQSAEPDKGNRESGGGVQCAAFAAQAARRGADD